MVMARKLGSVHLPMMIPYWPWLYPLSSIRKTTISLIWPCLWMLILQQQTGMQVGFAVALQCESEDIRKTKISLIWPWMPWTKIKEDKETTCLKVA
jgi:hypothetical protein